MQKQSNPKRDLILTLLVMVVLVISVFGFIIFGSWLEAQETEDITPESVVRALQDAGYRVSNVQETDDYPGPMAFPVYGIRFDIHTNDTTYNVLVVSYDNPTRARRSVNAINDLDRRMNGGYAYAFCRGVVLVQIFPSDVDLGHNLNEVLRAIE